jgi:aquaporin Z
MPELKVESYVSEFIGTFFLVFTIGMNVLQNTALAPVSIGSILMVMVFATGSVSGAHFNPAVTLGVLCSQPRSSSKDTQIDVVSALIYIVVHMLGSLFAGFMYYWVLGATFTFQPGTGYGVVDAAMAELLFTTALVFVVLNTATTQQDNHNQYYGLAIGFTLMSAAFAVGSVSGCCLNPAVAFGVMFSHYYHTGTGLKYFLLYMIIPCVGAMLAATLFRIVRRAEYRSARELP